LLLPTSRRLVEISMPTPIAVMEIRGVYGGLSLASASSLIDWRGSAMG